MRKTAAVIVMALTVIPLYFTVMVPWRCNIFAKTLESALQAALRKNPGAQAFLRDNVSRTEAYRKYVPDDASLNIALATTYNLFGRYPEAVRVYDEAFKYDQRPEMYFNRAGIRLRMGDREGAYEDFLIAVRFNPALGTRIRDTAIRTRVLTEMTRLYGKHSVRGAR